MRKLIVCFIAVSIAASPMIAPAIAQAAAAPAAAHTAAPKDAAKAKDAAKKAADAKAAAAAKAKADEDLAKQRKALAIGSIALVTAAILALAWKSEVLRDSQPPDFAGAPLSPTGDPAPEKEQYQRSFSLSQTQMTWWFWIVLSSFLYIAWTKWDIFGGLNEQALTLTGIGVGTAIGAAIIDQSKKDKAGPLKDMAEALAKIRDPATPATDRPGWIAKFNAAAARLKSVNFLADILSDVDGISLHRFQSFAWTFVLGGVFLISVFSAGQMPTFNAYELTLLGISAGTYLGLKIPEQAA